MRCTAFLMTLMALALPGAADALALNLPGIATRNARTTSPEDSYRMPVTPYRNGTVETVLAEGTVSQEAWRTRLDDPSTLAILTTLRTQLYEAGFVLVFECETDTCGGFDFRFANRLIGEPDMHVDLGDFRCLTASRETDTTTEYVSLLVSRSSEYGYVHVTHVSPGTEGMELAISTKGRAASITPEPATPVADPTIAGGPLAELGARGAAILSDLEFNPGAAQLDDDAFASLDSLASYLKANPGVRIALVGHTDTAGGLEANVALSRKRAGAVRQRLEDAFGIDPERVDVEGVGYLSPIASNATAEGRAKNRRVEVVLTSTQ